MGGAISACDSRLARTLKVRRDALARERAALEVIPVTHWGAVITTISKAICEG